MSTSRRCFLMVTGRSTREDDRFCGFTNPPLSEAGRNEVLAFRQKIIDEGTRLPKTWYVSDRRRAAETFEIMTAGMHAPVIRFTKSLREMNFGDFENLSWAELPTDFQRHYEYCQHNPMDLEFPGGESFRDMCARVSQGALELLSYEGDDSDIAIVAHQGSGRLWHLIANDEPPSTFFVDTPTKLEHRWLGITLQDVANWRRKFLQQNL